jgi:hypothetical protein
MKRTWWKIPLVASGHVVGTGVVALTLAFLVMDGSAIEMVFGAIGSGSVAGTPWLWVGIHLFLSAALWGMIAFAGKRLMKRDDDRSKRIIKLQSGTAMTEFLIILTPFLLLTSGLAQLAILNTASLLADVASYNATRAAWVWETQDDVDNRFIERKARVAAAMALAPSAPSDFSTDDAAEIKDLAEELDGGGNYAAGGNAPHSAMTYLMAYDTGDFSERVLKKLYFAYNAIDMNVRIDDENVESNFTYQMNCVFPWFAYIWGDRRTVSGRSGFYVPIRRRHTLPKQLEVVTP